MWTAISRAAHSMHMVLGGVNVQHGACRQAAKIVQRTEYGPGRHGEGIPEALTVRRLLRTRRHLLNLKALVNRQSNSSLEARTQLLAAIRHDAKLCPQAELACRWVVLAPSEQTIDYAAQQLHRLLTEARINE